MNQLNVQLDAFVEREVNRFLTHLGTPVNVADLTRLKNPKIDTQPGREVIKEMFVKSQPQRKNIPPTAIANYLNIISVGFADGCVQIYTVEEMQKTAECRLSTYPINGITINRNGMYFLSRNEIIHTNINLLNVRSISRYICQSNVKSLFDWNMSLYASDFMGKMYKVPPPIMTEIFPKIPLRLEPETFQLGSQFLNVTGLISGDNTKIVFVNKNSLFAVIQITDMNQPACIIWQKGNLKGNPLWELNVQVNSYNVYIQGSGRANLLSNKLYIKQLDELLLDNEMKDICTISGPIKMFKVINNRIMCVTKQVVEVFSTENLLRYYYVDMGIDISVIHLIKETLIVCSNTGNLYTKHIIDRLRGHSCNSCLVEILNLIDVDTEAICPHFRPNTKSNMSMYPETLGLIH